MMRKLLPPMIMLQMAFIGFAAAAALVEIETIVVSGPLFSLLGVAIAACASARAFRRALYFGVSVPAISVVCFSMIVSFGWGPGAAHVPIGSLLVVFALASLPLGLWALREISSARDLKPSRPLQFRVAWLLGLMAVVSLPLALYRIGPHAGALGVLLAYSFLLGFTLHRFHAGSAIPPNGFRRAF